MWKAMQAVTVACIVHPRPKRPAFAVDQEKGRLFGRRDGRRTRTGEFPLPLPPRPSLSLSLSLCVCVCVRVCA